jgi:hypothetical protein
MVIDGSSVGHVHGLQGGITAIVNTNPIVEVASGMIAVGRKEKDRITLAFLFKFGKDLTMEYWKLKYLKPPANAAGPLAI